jgi:hypothetical protein
MKRSQRRSSVAILSCLAGLLAFASSAQAALTSPADGSVQRGDVLIADPAGATVSGSFGALCQATYRVRVLNAAGVAVLDRTVLPNNLLQRGATGAINLTWATESVPNGNYRVETAATDRSRTSLFGSCSISATRTYSAAFELRKWEHRFVDAAGKGTVFMNVVASREFQIQLGDRLSPIVQSSDEHPMVVVSAPKGSSRILPPDLGACLADLTACLPATPSDCNPRPEICEPRIVLIDTRDEPGGAWGLIGFFDLRTHAFASLAAVGDRTELLGTVAPACGEIRKVLAEQGLDIDAVLGGIVVPIDIPVDGGGPRTVNATAAELCAFAEALAVELATSLDGPTGILGTPEVAAGLIVHLFVDTRSGPAGTVHPPRYDVHKSALVPTLGTLDLSALSGIELPPIDGVPLPTDLAGLLATLAPGGQLTQVKGGGWSGGTHVAGALNADTAPGPDDMPIWLPLLTTGTLPDKKIDFIGYPLTEPVSTNACFTLLGTETCLSFGGFAGTGAAIFNDSIVKLPLIP